MTPLPAAGLPPAVQAHDRRRAHARDLAEAAASGALSRALQGAGGTPKWSAGLAATLAGILVREARLVREQDAELFVPDSRKLAAAWAAVEQARQEREQALQDLAALRIRVDPEDLLWDPQREETP